MMMAVRGKKHSWRLSTIWGEDVAHCSKCGLLGRFEAYAVPNGVGVRGKPAYGCPEKMP